MNVPFVTGDKDLDAKFVKEAKEAGLENLKGHRTVGGMRASIYNAMPMEGVEKLVAFMKEFEAQPVCRINPEDAAELGIETAKLRKKDDLIAAIVAVPVEPGEEISEDDLPDLSAAAPVV